MLLFRVVECPRTDSRLPRTFPSHHPLKLASQCAFYHPPASLGYNSGQNLYIAWGSTPTAEQVLKAWANDESVYYDKTLAASYRCKNGESCGHFTQVMCGYFKGILPPSRHVCNIDPSGENTEWVGCARAKIPAGACAKCPAGNNCLPTGWDGATIVACNYRRPGNCGSYVFKPAGGKCDPATVPN